MAILTCEIPDELSQALEARLRATGESASQYVSRVLRRALNRPVLTLFQVSTSRALIEGVYAEAVSSSRLLSYGDFGLGTFDSLDGEMVVLDGAIYQIRSDGNARRAEENTTRSGETFTVQPGDVLLAEDHTGTKHKWRLTNDDPWRGAYVIFAAGANTQFIPDRSQVAKQI